METDHERERMRKAGNIATWPMQLSKTFIEPERHQQQLNIIQKIIREVPEITKKKLGEKIIYEKPTEEDQEAFDILNRYVVLNHQGEDFKNLLRKYDNIDSAKVDKERADKECGPQMSHIYADHVKMLKKEQDIMMKQENKKE